MSDADLFWFPVLTASYDVGMWLVVVGVVLEGTEIAARRIAKWRSGRFVGPLKDPLPDPATPRWAHDWGDLGFFLLVLGLLVENVSHVRLKQISDTENAQLTRDVATTGARAARLNLEAANARLALEETRQQVSKIDPLNLPIRKIEVVVILSIKGKFVDRAITNRAACTLTLWTSEHVLGLLRCSQFEERKFSDSEREFVLGFDWPLGDTFSVERPIFWFDRENVSIQQMEKKLAYVHIHVPGIEGGPKTFGMDADGTGEADGVVAKPPFTALTDFEVSRGSCVIIFNGTLRRTFSVPKNPVWGGVFICQPLK